MLIFLRFLFIISVIVIINNDNVVSSLEDWNFFELAALLDPIPPKFFLEEFFDKKVVHISHVNGSRASLKYRRNLFNESSIKATFLKLVEKSKIANPTGSSSKFKFVKEDQDRSFDCTNKNDCIDKLNKRFQNKETLLMQSVENFIPNLQDLKCSLEADLAASVGINVYWSPPNTTGFKLHHDGHDIIIVQTEGKKCWFICEKILKEEHLSAESRHYNINIENINAEKHTLGISCRNVTLQSGDVLYLPRGVLHAPHTNRCNNGNIPNNIQPTVTSSVEKSLHISIGIDVYSSRWASLFQNFILNHDNNSYKENKRTRVNNEWLNSVNFMNAFYSNNTKSNERKNKQLLMCPKVNVQDLIFPTLPGAIWTWEDVLKGYFMDIVEANTLSGHAMRENVPLWKFGKRYSSTGSSAASSTELVSLFKTGRLVDDRAKWIQLKSDFKKKLKILSDHCKHFLRRALLDVMAEFNLPNDIIQAKITLVSSQCSSVIYDYSKKVNFLYGINKILGFIISSHNQRCNHLSKHTQMVDSNQWLMDVINLETFISFSNDNPKSFSYNDVCSRKKHLLATNSAYYYGSLALMDINMKIDGELGKIENVVFFGPRGQNLISYVNASNIVETINSVQPSNEIKEIFCRFIYPHN